MIDNLDSPDLGRNVGICIEKLIAVQQRNEEQVRGVRAEATSGYEKMGCYVCDGLRKTCRAYVDSAPIIGSNLTIPKKDKTDVVTL